MNINILADKSKDDLNNVERGSEKRAFLS
jgi:hypothetical protein